MSSISLCLSIAHDCERRAALAELDEASHALAEAARDVARFRCDARLDRLAICARDVQRAVVALAVLS